MNKVALITGGTRGIGLGIATELAKLGCHLALNGVRDEEGVKGVLEDLKATGVDVLYCPGSVALAQARSEVISRTMEHFGQINFLINNAGVAPKERNDVLNTTEESFDYVLDTNLKGPFFLTQAVAKLMIEKKREEPGFPCQIINISSISATMASVNRGEYSISKSGVSMMTQLFASRLGEAEIPVYEIRPGIIETDMTAGVKSKYDPLIKEGLTVQPRWGNPNDVGKAVAAIVDGQFPYSTGQVFMVDGGLTIPRL